MTMGFFGGISFFCNSWTPYKAKDPLSHRGIGGLGQNQEATAWPGTGDVQEHSSAMGDEDLGHGLKSWGNTKLLKGHYANSERSHIHFNSSLL